MQIFDARGNEFSGGLDIITGQTITDARAATALLGALNAEAVADLNAAAVAFFDVRTAAGSLTFVFEGTVDGTNYFTLPAWDVQLGIYIASQAVTTTLAKQYAVTVTGIRRVRIRVSAYTSGNITVALRGTRADFIISTAPIPCTAIAVTAAANAALTLTIPAPPAGLFIHLCGVNVQRTATAALAGTATLVISTTNLPGSYAWSVGNAMLAGGTQKDVDEDYPNPIRASAAGTAVTIVTAAPGAAVLWRIGARYYYAP